jgi:hypothetical protein
MAWEKSPFAAMSAQVLRAVNSRANQSQKVGAFFSIDSRRGSRAISLA